MDRFRTLEYFVAAAHARSFSGAARRCGISVPAMAKAIGQLEAHLGVKVFARSPRGLTLTGDGQAYLDQCEPLIAHLDALDASMRESANRPRGVLSVGTVSVLARHCLGPALPAFHRRYPDLRLDLTVIDGPNDPKAESLDVLVTMGWRDDPTLVSRQLVQMRYRVVGTPAYWATHPMPASPADLAAHTVLVFRNHEGMALDVWQYERAGVHQRVEVKGWIVSDDRDTLLDLVLAGEGIARFTDLTIREHVESGRLVPALTDWDTRDAPPIRLMYRPSQRRLPRVRAFADFVTELFGRLDAERDPGLRARLSSERQIWQSRHATWACGSASEVLRRTRPDESAEPGLRASGG